MKKHILIILLLFLPAALIAQNVNGRVSTSVYTFERFQDSVTSDTYIRSFSNLSLNVNKNQFSLRTRLAFETGFSNALEDDGRLRLYNLYLEGRDLFEIATVKFGRQSFFNSVGAGVYDAASLKLKYGDYSVSGFIGSSVRPYQPAEMIKDPDENYLLNGKITARPIENLYLAASYVDKNIKPLDYTTQRMDANNNLVNILIQSKSNQYTFLSGEAGYKMPGLFRTDLEYEYDLNYNETSKIEFSGRYEQIENLGINLYYLFREPKIRYNSIFAIFNFANTQEVEAGVDYKINEMFTVTGKYGHVTYEDETSKRLTFGVNTLYGNISYRKTLGYAGELDALSLWGAHTILDGMLTPSLGVSYTSYKLSEDADTESITSFMGGVNYRPATMLSFDLQAQYFDTKIYQNDVRILFKANYWFNSNLNVF